MFDPDLKLFVDDLEIHQLANVEKKLNKPGSLPEPVLKPELPWEEGCEFQCWGSVIKESENYYRIYYGLDYKPTNDLVFCMAESSDGIHWERPNLGLYEWRGTKNNNVILTFDKSTPAGIVNGMDGFTVIKDEEESNPDMRYKMIATLFDGRRWGVDHPSHNDKVVTEEMKKKAESIFGHYLRTSNDGIHWSDKVELIHKANRDYMMVLRDFRNKEWRMMHSPKRYRNMELGHKPRRDVAFSSTKDWKNWTDPEMAIFNGPENAFGRLWEWHGLTPFNYGNIDLGFLEYQNSSYGLKSSVELVSHRDGGPWQRVFPGEYFLKPGPEGSWHRWGGFPTHNYPIQVGDQLYIYVNSTTYPDDYLEVENEQGTQISYRQRIVGIHKIGLDRFVGYSHGHEKTGEPIGLIVTKPVTITKPELLINTEPCGGGDITVTLKNAPDMSDIPGYTLEDSIPSIRNRTRSKVQWKTKNNVQELMGKSVFIVFNIRRSILYSYKFSE